MKGTSIRSYSDPIEMESRDRSINRRRKFPLTPAFKHRSTLVLDTFRRSISPGRLFIPKMWQTKYRCPTGTGRRASLLGGTKLAQTNRIIAATGRKKRNRFTQTASLLFLFIVRGPSSTPFSAPRASRNGSRPGLSIFH